MVFKCFNCQATDNLYAAPHTQEMRERWLELFPEGDMTMFNDSFRICAEHFDNKYILPTGLLSTRAVPTKFLVHNVWCFFTHLEKGSNRLTNEQILPFNTNITNYNEVLNLIMPTLQRQNASIENFKETVAPLQIFQEQPPCPEFDEFRFSIKREMQPKSTTQSNFTSSKKANEQENCVVIHDDSTDAEENYTSKTNKAAKYSFAFKKNSVVYTKNPRKIMQLLLEELQDDETAYKRMDGSLLSKLFKYSKRAEVEKHKLRMLKSKMDHYSEKLTKYKLFWDELIKTGIVSAESFQNEDSIKEE